MLDEKIQQVSRERLRKAEQTLGTTLKLAQNIETDEDYATIVNRSYYCIFHCMRAVVALDNFDSKKHSGIISYFRQHYIKTGKFPVELSGYIEQAFLLRNNSDYVDFAYFSEEEVNELIENATIFLNQTRAYLALLYT